MIHRAPAPCEDYYESIRPLFDENQYYSCDQLTLRNKNSDTENDKNQAPWKLENIIPGIKVTIECIHD